ncbi:DUF1266 domain-containing protein [Leucobacter sp.]
MELLKDALDWLLLPENKLFFWLAVGVAVVLLLFVLLAVFAKFAKQGYHKGFPTDSREANLLALGFQQITNSGNYWNDPTASNNGEGEEGTLREMWGLNSTQDVIDTVERLVVQRRRREVWQQLLEIRAAAARENDGRKPSTRQWLAAIKQAGGTGKGEERDFVGAVAYYEKELGKKHYPAGEPVVSLDAYAFGQAVAVCTWAVGMGLISQTDAMRLIGQVNEIARPEFDSWAAFGRSYALGRAMHWSDGVADEKRARQSGEAISAMESALDGKRRGPWGLLPWQLPAA